jgi:hypothetical protein
MNVSWEEPEFLLVFWHTNQKTGKILLVILSRCYFLNDIDLQHISSETNLIIPMTLYQPQI